MYKIMDNQNLENRIQALEKWKEEKTRQQINFPLDFQSIQVLGKYFMHIVNSITYAAGAGGHEFTEYIGKQDDVEFLVNSNTYVPYTVNLASNTIMINGYMDDDRGIDLITSDTPPTPLSILTHYYAINSTGTSFQLTTVQGNAGFIVTITDTGVGNQYLVSLGFI